MQQHLMEENNSREKIMAGNMVLAFLVHVYCYIENDILQNSRKWKVKIKKWKWMHKDTHQVGNKSGKFQL